MVLSMTGFAATTAIIPINTTTAVNISISIKSLNSRFFEATCKMPYALNHLETKIIQLLKAKLHRGHLYFTVHMQNSQALKGTIEPAFNVIEGYINAIRRIQDKFPIAGSLTIDHLLRLPDVFTVQDASFDETFEHELFNKIQNLIAELIQAQAKEGATLKIDLETRCSKMHQEIAAIEKTSLALIEQQKIKINDHLQQLATPEQEQPDARKNALLAGLDKMDIHEEIVRFKSHLTNFTDQLESTSLEKGKQLDFILQELARETNTIAAKCSDAGIGARAITLKVELEKAREQVQNII